MKNVILNSSSLNTPLNQLLEESYKISVKDVKTNLHNINITDVWGAKQDASFENKKINSSPLLLWYNPNKILDSD